MVGESTEFLIGSTMAQFEGLQEAEETQIVPGALGDRAIPIGAVADFSDGVRLSLTKDEVRDLPLADPAPGED